MENQEINLEKVHRLIDSLKSEAVKGNANGMLSTAQIIVAELQHMNAKINHPDYKSGCVSVVMPYLSKIATHHPFSGTNNADSLEMPNGEADNAGVSLLQPPTIITESSPSEATDRHSFDVLPVPPQQVSEAADPAQTAPVQAATTSASSIQATQEASQTPIQKELFTLQPEEEEGPLTERPEVRQAPPITPLEPADYPTSIPEDSPEIQVTPSEIQSETGTDMDLEKVASERLSSEVEPAPEHIDNYDIQEHTNNSAESAPIQLEQTPEEKKRHMAFISDNFSTWADYGMSTEAPTLVQNQPVVQEKQTDYHKSFQQPLQQQNYRELNEQLGQPGEEWAQKMQSTPIENLASAIGVNDRYLYISELFRGDESMYERSIITLNKFSNFHDAHAWSERELRLKLGWDTQNQITRQFEQLIKRRFNQAS